jgi:hypothetical protein
MLVSVSILLAGALAAQEPDPIEIAWRVGDLASAGALSVNRLETPPEDGLSRDGAILGFVAGLAAIAEGEGAASQYYFWVADLHERRCGSRLSQGARELLRRRKSSPGENPHTDRFFLSSPYRSHSSGPCIAGVLPDLDAVAAEHGTGETAVGVALIRWAGDGELRRFSMIYDYPRGEVTRLGEELLGRAYSPGMRYSRTLTLVLDPCQTFIDAHGSRFEVCRPGHDPAAP